MRRIAVRWYAPRLLATGRSWEEVERGFRLLATDSRQTWIAGPWTGSASDELLYWIPFLRWAIEANRIDPKRVVAVSANGASSWYRGVCGRFVAGDAPDARGAKVAATTLLALVARYRDGRDPLRPILRHARHRPLDPGTTTRPASHYVCISSDGASRDVRVAIEEAADTLRRRVDIVPLDECRTLDEISASIGGAAGLLVPMSHLAYLGQAYGVPTIAIVDPAAPFSQADEEVGRRAGRELESSALIVATSELRTLLGLLPAIDEGRQAVD